MYLGLHRRGLSSHHLQPQRPYKPNRPPLEKPFHILASQQRNVLAEFLTIKLRQPTAVVHFLLAHLDKNLGRRRVLFAKPIRIVGVYPRIFLLHADRQRKHLLFAKAVEISHVGSSPFLNLAPIDRPDYCRFFFKNAIVSPHACWDALRFAPLRPSCCLKIRGPLRRRCADHTVCSDRPSP